MTEVQKQCCLAALGYYPHREIDGIWGPKSQAAEASFEAENPGVSLLSAMSMLEEGDNWWRSVRHFTREEFRCRCGGKFCNGFPAEPSRTLVELADDIREEFGKPAILSSGLRCREHNAASGGVSNSRHMSGKAMDFMVLGITGEQLLRRAQQDSRTRYAYIIDNGPYVHIDVA